MWLTVPKNSNKLQIIYFFIKTFISIQLLHIIDWIYNDYNYDYDLWHNDTTIHLSWIQKKILNFKENIFNISVLLLEDVKIDNTKLYNSRINNSIFLEYLKQRKRNLVFLSFSINQKDNKLITLRNFSFISIFINGQLLKAIYISQIKRKLCCIHFTTQKKFCFNNFRTMVRKILFFEEL